MPPTLLVWDDGVLNRLAKERNTWSLQVGACILMQPFSLKVYLYFTVQKHSLFSWSPPFCLQLFLSSCVQAHNIYRYFIFSKNIYPPNTFFSILNSGISNINCLRLICTLLFFLKLFQKTEQHFSSLLNRIHFTKFNFWWVAEISTGITGIINCHQDFRTGLVCREM